MQVPRVRARGKEECRVGHGRDSTRRDALHYTCTYIIPQWTSGTRAVFLIVRRARAKRDVV